MKELITVPTSIRERLEQAQLLAKQDKYDEAEALLKQMGTELASTRPELHALLIAGYMGFAQTSAEEIETNTQFQKEEFKLLGVTIWEKWVPRTTTRKVNKTWNLS